VLIYSYVATLFLSRLQVIFWVLGLGVTPLDHIMSPWWLVINHTIK
jgi:hypothetical protein